MKNPNLPNIKECIAYVENCGWNFQHYTRPWYVFRSVNGRKTCNGSTKVSFTLTEIREAFKVGW